MQLFSDKVVLITGGARGIGHATAHRFATQGASVALIDLNEKEAVSAAAALTTAEGARAIGIGANVADASSVDDAVNRVVSELGGVHVLINNAGVTRDNLLFRMTEEDWDIVFDVHLKGSFLVSRAVQKHFVEQRFGNIINISSVSALGSRGQANYSAAKAGVQGFTRTLAMELGPFGIRVNAVAPGYIQSEMTDATARRMGLEPEELRQSSAEVTPLRRVGNPEDVASVVTFLAGNDSAYVTGQTIYIDGGQSLGG